MPVKTQPKGSDQRGENMAEFKTDIEIAQESQMMPITEIAKIAGVDDKYLEQYGKYKAKVDYNILKEVDRPNGKLVLVTAINPTPAGEGKTTTTVGLADGMKKLGKNVIASASRAVLQAADTHRSSRWKTSTFTSQVTSTQSVQPTTCSQP